MVRLACLLLLVTYCLPVPSVGNKRVVLSAGAVAWCFAGHCKHADDAKGHDTLSWQGLQWQCTTLNLHQGCGRFHTTCAASSLCGCLFGARCCRMLVLHVLYLLVHTWRVSKFDRLCRTGWVRPNLVRQHRQLICSMPGGHAASRCMVPVACGSLRLCVLHGTFLAPKSSSRGTCLLTSAEATDAARGL